MKDNHITPPGVMLYTGFYESLKTLPEEMVGKLVLALMEYNMFGTVPEFEGVLAMAWPFIRGYADRDRKRYEEVRSKRRLAAAMRWARTQGTDIAYEDTEPVGGYADEED